MFPRKHKPILIAIAFSLTVVALSLWYTKIYKDTSDSETPSQIDTENIGNSLRGLDATDHVLGNPKAPIVFIVYSDFACPYCKDYHASLRALMRLYGAEGQVAIAFRHMPYVQLHPEAPMYALASECVAKEKGNAAFWAFADKLFEAADPLKPQSAAELVLMAETVGATRQAFVACMRSNELMAVVERDFQEVVDAGVTGSPFTLLVEPSGRSSYEGAQTFRILAESVQKSLRTMDFHEVESPSSGSYMDEFEALESEYSNTNQEASTSTTTATTEVQATSSQTQKQSSILDGILEE